MPIRESIRACRGRMQHHRYIFLKCSLAYCSHALKYPSKCHDTATGHTDCKWKALLLTFAGFPIFWPITFHLFASYSLMASLKATVYIIQKQVSTETRAGRQSIATYLVFSKLSIVHLLLNVRQNSHQRATATRDYGGANWPYTSVSLHCPQFVGGMSNNNAHQHKAHKMPVNGWTGRTDLSDLGPSVASISHSLEPLLLLRRPWCICPSLLFSWRRRSWCGIRCCSDRCLGCSGGSFTFDRASEGRWWHGTHRRLLQGRTALSGICRRRNLDGLRLWCRRWLRWWHHRRRIKLTGLGKRRARLLG